MALAWKKGQPRPKGKGQLWLKTVIAVLCIWVVATWYQSNQNLLASMRKVAMRSGSSSTSAHDSSSLHSEASAASVTTAGQGPDHRADNGSDEATASSSSDTEVGGDAATKISDDANSRVSPPGTPLLYFDSGRAYHHLPECPWGWAVPGLACDAMPCPVRWGYTEVKQKADAVIYNTLDGMSGWGEANSRPPGQWAVMYAMESGQYYPTIYTAKEHGANITADYRLDCDVPVTYYTRWEYPDLKVMSVPFIEKRKDGLIAVFISNCGPKNDREIVLARLIELLPGLVHSYGGCQHNKEANDSKLATFSTYKFAFTPENSNDPGYVTEKVYHALTAGTVPIYIGAPDIHRFVPMPEAVLRVEDFNSTVELVEYIKKAAEDEALYNKHVAWKQLPESEWSEDWKMLERLTNYSAHCRIAMHMAGRPHQWREM